MNNVTDLRNRVLPPPKKRWPSLRFNLRPKTEPKPGSNTGLKPGLKPEGKPTFKVPVMALAAVVVVGVLVGGVFGVKYIVDNFLHKKDDSAQVLSEVKQIFPYLLPSEMPTVATVTDVNKLAGQEFFRNAQNGDRVLVFSVAHIAIVYRHSQRSIVNFGPISAQTTATPVPLVNTGGH